MTSRTSKGKHTKRFIIEVKFDRSWTRSGNEGLKGFFATREEAQAALHPEKALVSGGLEYRIRQK